MNNIKILIISNNSFTKYTNNGKTLYSLFGHFDKNNLNQLFFRDYGIPDFSICNNFYRITDYDALMNFLFIKNKLGAILIQNTFASDYFFNFNFSFLKSSFILRVFRDLLWLCVNKKNIHFLGWLDRIKPDLIFFLPGRERFSHDYALLISKRLNIPLFVYFTDDYILNYNKRNLFSRIVYNQRYRTFKKTINHASDLFAISSLMAIDYSKYFDRKFGVLINSVHFGNYQHEILKNQNYLILSYFGSLHTGRDKMLIKLAKILHSLNLNIIINLYTTDSLNKFVIHKYKNLGINYLGQIFNDDLKIAILESDILLHIESDILTNINKTYYSISTKIPEYLISKKPILAFGPTNIASFKLLSENNIGYVISSNDDVHLIENKLLKFFNDINLRLKLTLNGYLFAKENFNNKTMREKLNESIIYRINNYKV